MAKARYAEGDAASPYVCVVMVPLDTGRLDPLHSQMLAGISASLAAAGRQLVLMAPNTRAERDRDLEFLLDGRAAGAIFVGVRGDDALPERLIEARVPVAMTGRPPRGLPISYVDCENREAGRLATEHLVAIGRRCIGTIGGPLDVGPGLDRLLGYRDAVAAAGLPLDPTLEETAGREPERALLAMERLLLNHPDLDAVFVTSDVMAALALRVIQHSHRRVPEDVAVVGFGDSFVATMTHPALTSLRQPIDRMAAEVVRLLLRAADGEATEPEVVGFPTELVVRESTGGSPLA